MLDDEIQTSSIYSILRQILLRHPNNFPPEQIIRIIDIVIQSFNDQDEDYCQFSSDKTDNYLAYLLYIILNAAEKTLAPLIGPQTPYYCVLLRKFVDVMPLKTSILSKKKCYQACLYLINALKVHTQYFFDNNLIKEVVSFISYLLKSKSYPDEFKFQMKQFLKEALNQKNLSLQIQENIQKLKASQQAALNLLLQD